MLVLQWGRGCSCPQLSFLFLSFSGESISFPSPPSCESCELLLLYLSGICICCKIPLALGLTFRTVSPRPPRPPQPRAALISPPSSVSFLLTPVFTCCLDSPQACRAQLQSSSWTLNLWTSSLWVGVRPTPTL